MKKIILSALVVAMAATGCKKDKETVCNLDAAGIVGSYKITSVLYKADASTPEVDLFTLYDACEKDDIIKLNSGGTVTYQDAGTVCTPPGDDTGTWSLSGTTLTIDGEAATVSNYSCSGMTGTITGTTAGEYTKIVLARQ
jgi:hypothetical protein